MQTAHEQASRWSQEAQARTSLPSFAELWCAQKRGSETPSPPQALPEIGHSEECIPRKPRHLPTGKETICLPVPEEIGKMPPQPSISFAAFTTRTLSPWKQQRQPSSPERESTFLPVDIPARGSKRRPSQTQETSPPKQRRVMFKDVTTPSNIRLPDHDSDHAATENTRKCKAGTIKGKENNNTGKATKTQKKLSASAKKRGDRIPPHVAKNAKQKGRVGGEASTE